jgi:hypothetical protein
MTPRSDRAASVLNSLRVIISTLEEIAPSMPSVPDMSDTDMALMYLRHVTRHLEGSV